MSEGNHRAKPVTKAGKARQRGLPGFSFGPAINPAVKEWTVLICGPDWIATTALARAAKALGLDFGSKVNERLVDEEFVGGPVGNRQSLVRTRNSVSAVWGAKLRPGDNVMDFLPLLRNPRVVYAWQDPLARTLADSEAGDDLLTGLAKSVDAQMNTLGGLVGVGCPVLVVSSQNASSFPRRLVRALAEFTGMRVPADLGPAIQAVNPERKATTRKKPVEQAAAGAKAVKRPKAERRARRLERRAKRQKANRG